MDLFKKTQVIHLGHGGVKCKCCNHLARKRRGTVDKKFNRMARAKMKSLAQKEISITNY